VPAIAWPTDFPSGWPTPAANIHETTPGSDHLEGWSVIDHEAPIIPAAWDEPHLEAWVVPGN
jgi:hypothetical protein